MNSRVLERLPHAGFSLFEIVAVIAAIGLVTTVSFGIIGDIRKVAGQEKLSGDTDTLNRAVAAYLSSGGSLDDARTPADVLTRLKSAASADQAYRLPGFSSSLVDPRISCMMQSEQEAAAGKPRATWNPVKQRFTVASSGAPGIKKFILDETLAEVEAGTESRDAAFLYSKESTWVWDYQDRDTKSNPGPTQILLSEDPESPAIPGTPLTFVPPGTPTGPPPVPVTLDPPELSIPGGNFPISDFALAVGVSNPNPPGSSTLIFSVEYSNWLPLSSTVISIGPTQLLKVQAIPRNPATYLASTVTEATYGATPVHLLPPIITKSAAVFPPPSGVIPPPPSEWVKVDLTNPNEPSISRLEYRLNGGAWQNYIGPLYLGSSEWPEGLQVDARSVSTAEYWLDSEIESEGIEKGPTSLPAPLTALCGSQLNEYGLIVLGGKLKTSNDESGFFGDIAIAGDAEYDFGDGALIGNLFIDPTAKEGDLGDLDDQFGEGGNPISPAPRDLGGLAAEAIALSNQLAALSPDATYDKLDESTTLSANSTGGATVIEIDEISLSGGDFLTLTGNEDDYFIINVGDRISLSGGSGFVISGGLDPSHVIFNGIAGSGEFKLAGSSNAIPGTFLAPHSGNKVVVTGGSQVQGNIISGGNVELTGGAQTSQSNFSCAGSEPPPQDPIPLSPPDITLSDPDFIPGSVETVTVSLSNPNPPIVSELQYRVGGGAWTPYSTPFEVQMAGFPAGTLVEGIAVSIHPGFLNSTISSASIGHVGSPLPPPPPLDGSTLQAPLFSLPGGNFPITDFALGVEVTNPNPPGISTLIFSLDYGNWFPLTSSTVSTGPGQVLKAQAIPADPDEWESSGVTEATYGATGVQLQPPTIATSAAYFPPPSGVIPAPPSEIIGVSLTNPNAPAVSRLDYRLDGGSWQPYTGPFALAAADWPDGVQIEAYAVGTADYWLDSALRSKAISDPISLNFQMSVSTSP